MEPHQEWVQPLWFLPSNSQQTLKTSSATRGTLSDVPRADFLQKIFHCALSHHFSGRGEYTEPLWSSCYRARESLERHRIPGRVWNEISWLFLSRNTAFLIPSCPLAQVMQCAVSITQAKGKTELSSSAGAEPLSAKLVFAWISRMTGKVMQ